MKLSQKFAIIIVSVTMISLIIVGLIFSVYATATIKSRLVDQLRSVSTLKENQLNNYMDRSIAELEYLSSDPQVVEYMKQFQKEHDVNPDDNANSTLNPEEFFENTVSEILSHELSNSEFSKISILTMEGAIYMSTNLDEKGKIKSNEKYFLNGLNATYVQNFYMSISTREPAMTIATPILDGNGEVIGVLTGDIRLDEISNIMIERSGLGKTGETIIINKNHLLVSESRFVSDITFKKVIYTTGINECVDGNDGPKEYLDYRDVKVIGFLRWIPEREICLVTKIDSEEIYGSLNSLYLTLLTFSIILLICSILVAYFLSKLFTRSITVLVEGTERWSKGNFNQEIPVTSNDEIAGLCKAFNDASKEMLQSRELEKNYTADLKRELEQKTHDMKQSLEELEKSKRASLNIMDDLSESNRHLQDLDKAKTDFLNVASHELKTPLTAISAYLEILDDYKGQFNAEQLQGLDAIKRNSNQLKTLIGNILEISRLDSGRFDLNITEINVKEKIIALVDNLKILSDNKHIELKYDCDSVEKIHTDAMRFEEILNNLVGNAIKFTDKGSVAVRTEYGIGIEKGFVVVSVIDTGVGIADDKMKELFAKFYQVDATVSRKYGGTGLGLSITKKMIELQGGKISVSSVLGKGTTFRFILPIAPLTPLKKAVPQTNPSVNVKNDSKIAIEVDNKKELIKPAKSVKAKSVKYVASKNIPLKNMLKKRNRHSNSKQINRYTSKGHK